MANVLNLQTDTVEGVQRRRSSGESWRAFPSFQSYFVAN